jgi:hypothetical protein
MASKTKKSRVQGEGDYEAARRYRNRVERYVATHDASAEARKARPRSAEEARALDAAESAGKRRAKGEDPALRRRPAPRARNARG